MHRSTADPERKGQAHGEGEGVHAGCRQARYAEVSSGGGSAGSQTLAFLSAFFFAVSNERLRQGLVQVTNHNSNKPTCPTRLCFIALIHGHSVVDDVLPEIAGATVIKYKRFKI